jgi:kynurenine formamidase
MAGRFARTLVVAALLVVPACTSPAGRAVAPAVGLDLATARFVDLSHPFDAATIYWPNSPTAFRLDTLSYGPTPGGWFYSSFSVSTPEHGGTHLDAPIHFSQNGQTADLVPLERLIAPAVVIDITQQAAADPDYRLSAEDVTAWENANGTIEPGTIVLLRTGWSRFWPDKKAYLGDDTPGDVSHLHFPSYGEAAARLLVEERDVAALGADVASIDYGASADFIVHQVAMARNVPGFENLMNLDQVPVRGAWIAALPMKVAGGSGGPLRAVAILPAAAM